MIFRKIENSVGRGFHVEFLLTYHDFLFFLVLCFSKKSKNDVSTVSFGDLSNIQPLAIKPHDSAAILPAASLQDTPGV